jgi:ABC-type branched-subunit amino acid transport system ATPase component
MRAGGAAARVVLRTEKLTKRYGPVVGLEDLTLDLNAAEVLGYLGPNGAGKTTTIRLLLGLIKPTAGWAEIFGLDTQRDKVAVHARVAYVPGEATLWPSLTGGETLRLTAVCAAAAVLLSDRDLGASVLADKDTAPPRAALLGSPVLLAVRLSWAASVSWLAAAVVAGLLYGSWADSAGKAASAPS